MNQKESEINQKNQQDPTQSNKGKESKKDQKAKKDTTKNPDEVKYFLKK